MRQTHRKQGEHSLWGLLRNGSHSEGKERNRIMAFSFLEVLFWTLFLDILLHGAKSVHAFETIHEWDDVTGQQQQGTHGTACMHGRTMHRERALVELALTFWNKSKIPL